MVAGKAAAGQHGIVVLRAGEARGGKAFAHFHGLDRAHAHEGIGQPGVQLVEAGLAQAGGHVAGHHLHHAAQGVPGGTGRGDALFPERDHAVGGGEEGTAQGRVRIACFGGHGDAAQLHGPGHDPDAARGQQLFGDGPGRHAGHGLAPGGAAAAAIVADAVELFEKAPVRVPGPEDLGQIAVIAGALVLVGDVESDGRAGGQALEHAGKDADGIGFLAFGGRGALSGLAQVQLALQVFLAQGQACGAAVQHAAQTGPMGFAVRGEAQDAPKGIACHITPPCCGP